MISRYDNRDVAINDHPKYREILRLRKLRKITQYTTPNLKHPTASDLKDVTMTSHIWTVGDRFYKLASKHYGHPELWWVLAWFNQKPTEFHLKPGDTIEIPFPLDTVLGLLDV